MQSSLNYLLFAVLFAPSLGQMMESELLSCEFDFPEAYLNFEKEDLTEKLKGSDAFLWQLKAEKVQRNGKSAHIFQEERSFFNADIYSGKFADKIFRLPERNFAEMLPFDKQIVENVRVLKTFFRSSERFLEDVTFVKVCTSFCGQSFEGIEFCFEMIKGNKV